MTNPIDAVRTTRSIPEPRDEKRDAPDKADSTAKATGDRMKDQCLDVSDVQCRTKEAETLDVCMATRTAPAALYTPEDFPVAQPQDEDIPNFTPEDFPVVKD